MFKFLKEKITGWAKKISDSKAKEAEVEEEIVNLEEKKAISKKPEKKKIKEEKIQKEFSKEKPEKITESKFKTPEKKSIDEEGRKVSEHIIEDIKHDLKIKHDEETKKQKEEDRKGFFSRLKEKITKTQISEEEFSEYSEELQMILLENNVAFEVADKIIGKLKEDITEKEISKKEIEKEIIKSLKDIIEEILIEPFDLIEKIKNKSEEPYVILFCGINGSGKTTTIAKFATLLKKEKISCVLAAGDTFRAASIEQLKIHGEKIGIKVISHEYGSDPASVGFDAIQYAKKNNIQCVLIDTAGRMHTAKNLLEEIKKISKVCKPDTKIFLGESITGNDAVEQVKNFDETIGIDGIILSKADIDEKGGTALSVGYVTGKPILYLGTGQEYKDLEIFNKKKFIEKLGL